MDTVQNTVDLTPLTWAPSLNPCPFPAKRLLALPLLPRPPPPPPTTFLQPLLSPPRRTRSLLLLPLLLRPEL